MRDFNSFALILHFAVSLSNQVYSFLTRLSIDPESLMSDAP